MGVLLTLIMTPVHDPCVNIALYMVCVSSVNLAEYICIRYHSQAHVLDDTVTLHLRLTPLYCSLKEDGQYATQLLSLLFM